MVFGGTAVIEFNRCDVCGGGQMSNGQCRMHRSKETMPKSGTQFGSYMMNKKWPLEEQFAIHILRFQQV